MTTIQRWVMTMGMLTSIATLAGCGREAEVKSEVDGTWTSSDDALSLTLTTGDHYCTAASAGHIPCDEEPDFMMVTAVIDNACLRGDIGGSLRWTDSAYTVELIVGSLHMSGVSMGGQTLKMTTTTSEQGGDGAEVGCLRALVGDGLMLQRQGS